ncbi:hypothetical protein TEA_029673 [Camellia sinensis var. sinensis]|uniref:D-isomer specific 2-hydroxyacid dehydrogenase NAD-binding domain-containing protein n=1 Tax=Camellia sinensis var. sinensis TaxID=542762 RepID=A0A4S4EI63_CAMSN|nr:hypothetical protein TEA_029673 [Camellia sinensis var. sinensis]
MIRTGAVSRRKRSSKMIGESFDNDDVSSSNSHEVHVLAVDDSLINRKLSGKRVGIVGLGYIGSEVAKRLQAFGCSISYLSRQKKAHVPFPYYANACDLANDSDILIICCSLTNETYHLINKDVMTALGKKGVIINVARGAVVDEKELVQFLVQGHIGGAGLDVFENEPDVPKELFELDNVVMSPHKAVATPESLESLLEIRIRERVRTGIVSRRKRSSEMIGESFYDNDVSPSDSPLSGKRVGIVGLGYIGSEVAKRLQAFGCSISYLSRKKKAHVPFPYYANACDLANDSDILIICCSLTNETYHLINKDVITALGKKGVIINVARGAVVDEKELVQFLVQGHIGGAGLDVFENEPDVPKELFELDNVVMSPHKAVATPESLESLLEVNIANLEAFFSNKPLLSPIDLE